jgi:aspartate aminotransferase-like enzyme
MASPIFGTFFLPGPTEVRPEILETLSRPLIPHRDRDFEALIARIEVGLHDVFLTARPVYIGTNSATGFMEMAVRNTPPGPILALTNGNFSRRFATVAESCMREVVRISVTDGGVFDLSEVERTLASRAFVAVIVVHSETSTGVLTDVRAVADLAHRHGAIVLVDSVSGVGGAELCVDAWGLDFVFTGSQKALALPPGLAFAVASADFVERARTAPDRGYYFDIVRYDETAKTNQTPTTPATNLLYAVEAQMGDIGREGIERRWDRHIAMRDATIDWVHAVSARRDIDLTVVAPPGSRSPTVTAVRLPPGVASKEVTAAVRARNFVIGGGNGALKETTIRIGHMGDHTLEGLGRCLHVCEQVIAELAERKQLVRAR